MNQLLNDGCGKLNLFLTDRQQQQFEKYYQLLNEWNQVMNLTAITEYREVTVKHFIDSLSIIKTDEFQSLLTESKKRTVRILDVGTGAGFPGVPLKIVFPQFEIVLLDSLQKRLRFLEKVKDELELEGVHTLHGRAEDFAHKLEYRESFDFVVSRAVANLASLSEYCLPYVKLNGWFVSYKSGKIEEEIQQAEKAVKTLGGGKAILEKFFLPPDDNLERSLVKIKKIRATPGRFPRKAGLPGKEPIK